MSIILNFVISISIIALVIVQLWLVIVPASKAKEQAYLWWYMPWCALLFSVILASVNSLVHIPKLIAILPAHQVEGLFCIACYLIWILLQKFLRKSKVEDYFLRIYRKIAAKEDEKALPFPYFYANDEVKVRVGQKFYRWTLKLFTLVLALTYSIGLLFSTSWIPPFALIGLLPIIDYYIYLCADVPVEEVEKETIITTPITIKNKDFENLWKSYVETFDNYTVAWRRPNPFKDQIQELLSNNDVVITHLMDSIRRDKKDCIIENIDLSDAFSKLEPFFTIVEKSGKYVLIALDIPTHFTNNLETTYMDEIAEKMSEMMHKNVVVYTEEQTQDTLHNSIIITPLSLLLRQKIDEKWLQKIGLITVVNISDKGVSNLYECRRFSFLLESVNKDVQMVFITPDRRGMEPSVANTWLTKVNIDEQKMRQFSIAEQLYYIGYNTEEFRDRYKKILANHSPVILYAGSEIAPIALSTKFNGKDKESIPVHYFELAYSNAFEGKEELRRNISFLNPQLLHVTDANIEDNSVNHFLPLASISEEQHLSVIFDQENNAPVAYLKWAHIGGKENFSIILSKPYLFRDYFNANHDYFVSAPFQSLQPHLCKSRVTLAIILFHLLQQSKVEERDLREFLNRYYDEKEIISVPRLIQDLFKKYFDINLSHNLKTENCVHFDGAQYHHQVFYSIVLTDTICLPYLDTITIKDNGGNVLFEILQDLVYQNFNTGQIHSFSGRPYKIGDFSEENRTLTISTTDNSSNVMFYKPAQNITISGEREPIRDMDLSAIQWRHRITSELLSVQLEGFETNITVETTLWYEFSKYSLLGNDSRFRQATTPIRNYRKGKVLKVSFSFMHKPDYIRRKEDIRKGLQILLYESMQSLFPHHAQYLIISSLGAGDPELPWIFNNFSCEGDKEDTNTLSYYFIEDAHIDLGLIGALGNPDNIKYWFGYIYDYLVWLTEDGTSSPSEGYDEYLNRNDLDKTSFLKYGRESLPPYFDIDLLINFIRDLYGDDFFTHNPAGGRNNSDIYGFCDFCGTRIKNSEMRKLEDGRMRCKECEKDAIDTDEQFQVLCEKAKELFRTQLGIDFNTIPHSGKLISAVELHKMGGKSFSITNGYDVRQLVGLACDSAYDEFFVENGRNPQDTLGIICHEMTHIWQYNAPEFATRLGDKNWMEGLAVWTDLFLSECYGKPNIEAQRKGWLARTDEYGIGLQFIMEHCPDDPYEYIRKNL